MGEYLGRIKKTTIILIAFLFVTSLTAASASAASGQGNGHDKMIYDTLSSEHRQVADLLKKAMHDSSKETFFKIKAETDPHLLGEEKVFYPVLHQKKELRYLVDESLKEHKQIKSISSELESMDAGSKKWFSKIEELNNVVTRHVQLEENKVFPEAKKVLSQDKAQDINQQYLKFKQDFKQQQKPISHKK